MKSSVRTIAVWLSLLIWASAYYGPASWAAYMPPLHSVAETARTTSVRASEAGVSANCRGGIYAARVLAFVGGADVAQQDSGFEKWSERDKIGDDIPCASWINPRVKPWAVLLCIHGLSLHAANYEAFGKRMADIGVPTYAIDVRGFGSWQNTKERQNSGVDFKLAMDDIHRTLESLRREHPEVPIVLVGESMGGALALQASAKDQNLIDGLICSVPASKRTNQKMNTAKVAVGMLTAPNKRFKAGPSVVKAAAKENQELADMWSSDEMTRMNLSARELLAFAVFTKKNGASAAEITNIPVMFLQGGKDQLISPQGTLELYNKLATESKTMHIVNAEHLLLEYSQFTNEMIDFISGWIQRRAVSQSLARLQREDSKFSPEVLTKADAHLKIAEGFLKLKDFKSAETHLLKVVELSRGSHFARDAELLLCSLPDSEVAPKSEVPPSVFAQDVNFVTHKEALSNAKPSVIMFYADWIVGCDQVDEAINKALAQFGNQVNFVRLDADAPENQAIIQEYAVRPIPAVLYLSANNRVASYTFGYPGYDAITAKIRSLIIQDKPGIKLLPRIK